MCQVHRFAEVGRDLWMSPGPHRGHCLQTTLTSLTIEIPPCSWPQTGNTSPCELQPSRRAHDLCAKQRPACHSKQPSPGLRGQAERKPLPVFQGWGNSRSVKRQPTSQLTWETLALCESRSQSPALTSRQLQNRLRRTRHTPKCAGEASREGRLLPQSSKQKFLEIKPKILSHLVFSSGSKTILRKTRGDTNTTFAWLQCSHSRRLTVRHRPFTQAVEELTC